jgi:V/A-type H+-transporting ATPase subunit I
VFHYPHSLRSKTLGISYDFGGILIGVGIGSIIFGFLYGSVFGNEEIIRPLLIRPLENIKLVLMGGVVFWSTLINHKLYF